MRKRAKNDVLIVFDAADAASAQELSTRLSRDHFDIVLHRAGAKYLASKAPRVLLLLVSRHTFGRRWAELLELTFPFRDPSNKDRRFVPVVIDETPLHSTIRGYASTSWREQSPEEYSALIAACTIPVPPAVVSSAVAGGSTALETGRRGSVTALATSPDGRWIVAGGNDGVLGLWNLATRKVWKLRGHRDGISSIAITSDSTVAVSSSWDGTLRRWDLAGGKCTSVMNVGRGIKTVAIDGSGQRAVLTSSDSVVIGDLAQESFSWTYIGVSMYSIAVSRDGHHAIAGCTDAAVRLWNLDDLDQQTRLKGHRDFVYSVAMNAEGTRAVSGSKDKTVRVWDIAARRAIAQLEGHTGEVNAVAIDQAGRRAASASDDGTIRVWNLDNGSILATLRGHGSAFTVISMSPDGTHLLAGSSDGVIYVWELAAIDVEKDPVATMQYTNAKVLLVGESGVGKTGLAYRLAEDRFRDSISTDAAWATQLQLPQSDSDDTKFEREIWLWDFAGQADYRLIHQLYMDETALAVLVFNPQSENPFEALSQWDRDLERAAQRPFSKLLVAARCDRGGLMISRQLVEEFRRERGFAEYLETSALMGTGCEELRSAIVRHIAWAEIPWTASPRIFRLLKSKLIELKDEGHVLLRLSELKQQLDLRLPNEIFTLDEVRAVVALLTGPGVVWQLAFGDFVLLQPERINAYAAAVIRSVRSHPEEIGCVREEEIISARLDFQDMKRLPEHEEQIVLRAMHQTFVNRGLCLREHTDGGALLIFPSYFRRERPELGGHPCVLVSYELTGRLDEIYATLIVKLHHAVAFERDQLWRFAADFRTPTGRRLGVKLTNRREGSATLQVYFDFGISEDVQVTFIRYVHDHLYDKAATVKRVRHYVCPECDSPIENHRAVRERLSRGLNDIVCVMCESRVSLRDAIEEKFASEEIRRRAHEFELRAKNAIDNESRELILVGQAYAVVGEAGQIYRQYTNSDHGIDGEIEFKDDLGHASGKRVYLQLKSGDSYLRERADGTLIFTIKNERHIEYWQAHAYPVMLVIRSSDGVIRWMDLSEYLREFSGKSKRRQVVFRGAPFTAADVLRLRSRYIKPAGKSIPPSRPASAI
jgi:small GTP-binding protein